MSFVEWTKILSRAALEMAEALGGGEEISSKGYQREVLREALFFLGEQLRRARVPRRKGPGRIFVILPANVPLIPFQMAPLLEAYQVKAVFKRPAQEEKFYSILGNLTGLEFISLSHEETIERAREFDFVVGFGGEGLGKALAGIKVPHRFFGPRFSIGIVKEGHSPFSYFLDALSFDGEGCLCPVILFSEKWNFKEACNIFRDAVLKRPSQGSFNRLSHEYYTKFLSYYSREFCLFEDAGLFLLEEFPPLIPARSIILREARDQGEILNFLGEKASYLQAIISPSSEPYLLERTSASLVLPPSKAQFPPLGWYFEKGVTLENFFSPEANKEQ